MLAEKIKIKFYVNQQDFMSQYIDIISFLIGNSSVWLNFDPGKL